jgi:hypothetical protein
VVVAAVSAAAVVDEVAGNSCRTYLEKVFPHCRKSLRHLMAPESRCKLKVARP